MIPEAQTIWSGLEFRKPMLLRNIEPLSEPQLHWKPSKRSNSIAWLFWHIAEVEEIWISQIVTGDPLRFPFGVQMREAREDQYPARIDLIRYFHDVRELTRRRLEATTTDDLEREVEDKDFGRVTARDIWMGVVTSFAWHAGQIAMTAKMLPDSPIETLQFQYWRHV